MEYILSIHRGLLYKNMNLANGFFVRARGLSLKIFVWLQMYFGTVICLPANTQCSFSTQKHTVFRADFPIFPVGAAICRPQKRQRRFPLFFRVHAEYNRGIAAR